MKTIKTYNNTDKTFGVYDVNNNNVDMVFETEEEAREEAESLGEGFEVVRVEPKTTSPAQLRASAKYDKANTTGVYLKLNKETDKAILDHLARQENKQGYIKQLILADMEKPQK